ncbi:MAG: NAD(P)(+) transhydrogenase (Re/Si-specific) subunit beta [Proteobacteria bacterium]|nr:NAD(P)(+) transhydrogenase (Re/Si-specific) subunit beta [Pseudomonadota bacterium]
MHLNTDFFAFAYLVATILFIFGLKSLSHPKTALRGNRLSMLSMGLAVMVTFFHPSVSNYGLILAGLAIGALIGVPLAVRIKMTAMPQLVAMLHSFVGLAAVLVAAGTYLMHAQQGHLNAVLLLELIIGSAIGAVTFTGSLIAFGKLQALLGSAPLVFKGQHLVNALLILAVFVLSALFAVNHSVVLFATVTALSLLLGFLIVLPIGGSDMPVVVSMLNSYSGWAASATGFTLNNPLLIATGALVGSSGAILSYIMCKAMNRSLLNVILGGFGNTAQAAVAGASAKSCRSASTEDAAFMFENASSLIVIPGYGMAVAQAQHAVKELYEQLQHRGVDVKFAIHPVAGRMPGHMNVLLAESEIPYDSVLELEDINPEFARADAVLIIGANDVVNPAARTNKASPLYGMPILEAYKAKMVYVIKRSMNPGYSGVENDLFYLDNCALIFGDAKKVCEGLVNCLKSA